MLHLDLASIAGVKEVSIAWKDFQLDKEGQCEAIYGGSTSGVTSIEQLTFPGLASMSLRPERAAVSNNAGFPSLYLCTSKPCKIGVIKQGHAEEIAFSLFLQLFANCSEHHESKQVSFLLKEANH